MTFDPVLPAPVLIALAALVVAIRAVSLRRSLKRSARGHHTPVVLRWSGLTLAMLLLFVAAARPTLGDSASQTTSADGDVNVFFVVDRSVGSRVEDFGDRMSRMSGIRHDMTELIDQYPGARFAVISFASSSDLDWPLSQDVWSLKPMAAALSPYTSASPDTLLETNAGAGSDILRYELKQTAEQFPGSNNVVFYFGSGAAGSRAPQGTFDLGSLSVSNGAVLGYGTIAGGPIPSQIVDGQVVYMVDARNGAPLHSALDEPRLRSIADQLGVPYVHREDGQSVTAALSSVGDPPAGDAVSGSGGTKRVELYWVFSIAAAALVLCEIYLAIRQYRRNRVVRQEVEP